ncbi:MAG TPA: AAA family ATPase [Puia sp.]
MELIERGGFITSLQAEFERIAEGEGHCVLVSGEAGIGKTSLLRAFTRLYKNEANIYQGTCDALFTPRPLAPLYDVIWQIWGSDWEQGGNMNDRASLFTRFFHELGMLKGDTIIVFEDIHWADEATLDFIKFMVRRILRVHCLFILTYRDDEIHSRHPLRNVLGQLPADSFSRFQLTPLSKTAVEKLATQKGYSGENVYQISGGNPFYVSEILASYSLGVPDNIKDSILSVYNRQDDRTKQVWEILSVIPTGLEIQYLERMEPQYAQAVAQCLESGILQLKDDRIRFKHELYRRTVETSLSPFIRIALNKKILELFGDDFEKKGEIERIIHHAKNANDYELVVHYAPLAAQKAAGLGAHIEAAKLYQSAIEYYQGKDKDILLKLYEPYAYECYLTNKIKEAIIFQTKAHNIWKETEDVENLGNCTWFLSRLWWFDGNRHQAEKYAALAIETLRDEPSSRAKAMTYSNMSQLKMLGEQLIECIYWGDIAIALARELGDEEILCHALNNTGTAQMGVVALKERGESLLRQSLALALKNSFQEHAARAYANMASVGITTKDFPYAERALAEGIPYCEERELGSWRSYMLSCKARLLLETGRWKEACEIAAYLMKYEDQAPIIRIGALVVCGTIKMRKGEEDALPMLLEAKKIASEAMELQRIIPALVALLEYEWLTGTTVLDWEAIEIVNVALMSQSGTNYKNNDFDFWLEKTRKEIIPQRERAEGYRLDSPGNAARAVKAWEKIGSPYERALALFETSDEGKKEALSIVQQLGANAIYEKMKLDMRSSGIKNIPRGLRKTTLANPAQLTERELAVLELLKEGLQNKEIGGRLFISAKTVDHHISSVLFKLDVNSRVKAVQEALRLGIIK